MAKKNLIIIQNLLKILQNVTFKTFKNLLQFT